MGNPDVGPSDGTLVSRARRGDASAFEALVRRHYRTAYSVALGLLANAMDAEDVCQNAFLRALEKLDDCRQPDRFIGWLLQIVRNQAHNFRDYRRVRETSDLDEISAAGGSDSARDLETAELGREILKALESVTEAQRQVVLLHDMDGMKHREIAEALDISEGMSRQHLFQARKVLRKVLGAHILQEHFDD